MTDLTNCKILQDHPFNRETWIQDMVELQYRFGSKFIPFDECQTDPERLDWWTRDLCLDLQEEWSEVLRCLPWKHWKAYKDFVLNLEDIRYEAIDCLHFVLNIYLLLVGKKSRVDGLLDFSCIGAENQITDNIMLTERIKELRAREYKVADMLLSNGGLDQFHCKLIMKCLSFDLAKLFCYTGMDDKMVYTYYCTKNQENYDRQERGY